MLFWLKVIILLAIFVVLWIRHIQKRKTHPPGPLGFPLVGFLPLQIIQAMFGKYLPKICQLKHFRKMREAYGDYWSIEMGGQRVVTLASYEMITEGFVNHGKVFRQRPTTEVFKMFSGSQGIIFSNDELWKENRQMGIKAMRELGMGRKDLETQISDEGNDLIKYLASVSKNPVETSMAFIKAISNVVSRLVFKESNNYNDPDFQTYITNIRKATQSNVVNTICAIFPNWSASDLARYLFSDLEVLFNAWRDAKGFTINKCLENIKSKDETAEPSCVFDYFWSFRYPGNLKEKTSTQSTDIYQSMSDLYLAGSETINNVLIFSCLMLGRHQNIQDELRKEISSLTEDYRQVNMDMRKECPKLLAFIDEIFRYCIIVPKQNICVSETCMFMGYKLYPNDIILGDIGTMFKDPKLFPNPDVFDPYRFMDESRSKHIPNKHLTPFGIGKRACIGEGVAHMEKFLFLSRIILGFHITLPKKTLDNFDIILEGNVGFSHCPLEHEINFRPLCPT